MNLNEFHPVIAEWFRRRFETPTDPQAAAWPAIAAGADTLVAAPTGSGKTLAAFLWCLDLLFRRGLEDRLADATAVLYVSPLKALGNDVRKNLEEPLAEIAALARERGLEPPAIRVAVRSGDTPGRERRAQAKRPPHILVTTPESLFILLASESGRRGLGAVETAIVDEVHAVASDKRGAHLALSLERLDRLVAAGGGRRPTRVGLSATQRPIEEIARLLVGAGRSATIVDVGQRRDADLRVEVPRDELGAVAGASHWQDALDRVAEHVRGHRSTLVFVNTRRLVERVARALGERLGAERVGAHHGSLSRATRLRTEERLKEGDLAVVVTTASLELGIDIGAVDLVCQVGAPRAIRTLVQRVGRSGHRRGGLPKGRLLALTRDQLLECMAIVRAVRGGVLDRIEARRAPLDILAQHLVAAAACEDLDEEEAFAWVRRARPYWALTREAFEAVLGMLSEGISTRRGRAAALLHRDRVNGRIRGRRGARIAAITSGGAIPDTAAYDVVLEPEGTVVGSVDEDFAIESLAGDIFQLGNASYRILRIEASRVRVADADGKTPTIPFWRAEGPARTEELSQAVSALREEIAARAGPPDAPASQREARASATAAWLEAETGVEPGGARQAVAYVAAGAAALGGVPSTRRVVAERFFDEAGGQQLVVHAPLGARLNRALGLALRKRFCRSFDFELQAAATDDGIVLSLGPQHSFPLDVAFGMLRPETAREVLAQAVLASPMFAARWRWNAQRSLAIPRMRGGRKVPAPIVRFRAEDLLVAVFPEMIACPENHEAGDLEIPDHPLVDETLRDCFEEAMDLEGLVRLLEGIERGEVETLARETPEPSPFSHEILNANPYAFLDDAPLEERRARAVMTRRGLPDPVARDLGALDPAAIAAVVSEAWPIVRSADEAHDALLTLVALPEALAAPWAEHLGALMGARRATRLRLDRETVHLTAAERLPEVLALWPDAAIDPPLDLPPALARTIEPGAAAVALVRGWLATLGPTTAADLARRLALPAPVVDTALAALEADGVAMRGRFTPGATAGDPAAEWCERGLLARIHRLTIGKLRREIEPVSVAAFLRFALRWQHVAPGTQLHGEEGLLRAITQLEGFEAAAGAWEEEILRARVAAYQPAWLDALCLGGEVAWGRLAPRAPRPIEEVDAPRRRGLPAGRLAPIGIFLRESASWLLAPEGAAPGEASSHAADDVLRLLGARGASFVSEIVSGTGRLAAEVEDALAELVAAGRVTADGFQALRSLLVRGKRARAEGRHHGGRVSTSLRRGQGRWSLLRPPAGDPTGDPPPERPEALDRIARLLLRRWGVVFRDLLAREPRAPAWRELVGFFRRLEARGEVRGGRFVFGPAGEQFALPEALEALRAGRRRDEQARREGDASLEVVRVSACDPLNVVGILTPGPRVSPSPGRVIVFRDGVPALEEDPSRGARAAGA
jgi:ATP-dependent Lhr-like helicase